MKRLWTILRLGIKELRSLRADRVMTLLLVYTFSYGVYAAATGMSFEVRNAAIAVVDEDQSPLSHHLTDSFIAPYFKPAVEIGGAEIDHVLDQGLYAFVLHIPSNFEADLRGGRQPTLQVNIDATAMTLAGNGQRYIQEILQREIDTFLYGERNAGGLIDVVVRVRFNPNLTSAWFSSVMQVINNITMLSVILTGAAFIREREHGTIEHLLVLPVRPADIMLGKIWASGLVIVAAATLSLLLVVHLLLAVPIAGSLGLFILTAVLYEFSVTALGILLATFTTSMPQFGLLAIPVLIILNLLSGSSTPMESMPDWLQTVMQFTPTPHFVSAAQGILYRGAGIEIVWPSLAALLAIGLAFYLVALSRFRRALARLQS